MKKKAKRFFAGFSGIESKSFDRINPPSFESYGVAGRMYIMVEELQAQRFYDFFFGFNFVSCLPEFKD